LIEDYASDLQDIGKNYPNSVIDFLSVDFEHPYIPLSAFMTPISSGAAPHPDPLTLSEVWLR
jgi:hypothetical protein